VKQQTHAQNIEVLEEEAYTMTTTLKATQGIIKHATKEYVEKLHAHVTANIVDKILQKEIEVKEKTATMKETFKVFMTH
jgi:hypothetical protein